MAEWLHSLRHRLRVLLRRRQLERDLDDEMAFHLTMREAQLRRSGVDDAAARARRRFGRAATIREDLRDAWAFAPHLHALLRDCRYAARTLRHSAGFTVVVILTLGLGIGANTAFFSVVNAVLVRPLGYAATDRLMSLEEGFPRAHIDRLPFSALDYDDLRRDQRSFEQVAAYRNVSFEVSGEAGGAPERVAGAKVTAELFGLLGVAPAMGRTFSPADDRPGVHVAVLSWGFWLRRYGGAPDLLGRRVQLDRAPYTVIGVMPAAFVFPRQGPRFNGEAADVWVPMAFTERDRGERSMGQINSVLGRLKPGVSLAAARAELDVLSERIAANYPAPYRQGGFSPHLYGEPYREAIAGRFEAPLLLLLAAVGLVLLVACANVANLVLSRVTARRREFAVRTSLGARQGHLVQLLLCEALLLSTAGGVVGIAIAWWAVQAAPAVLTRTVPGLHDLTLDVRVLAFTAAMCAGTTLIFALVPLPALRIGRDRRRASSTAADSLRDESPRATSSVNKLRLQRAFVVVTVSLACMLLVGAGLFIRSFAALVSTDVGFRPARVLTASITLPRTVYATAASVRTFHDTLSRDLRTLPGVRSVALATNLPLTTYDLRGFTPEGPAMAGDKKRSTSLSWVHGPYFETLGMTLRRGRFFTADEHTQNRRVLIVNEKFAAHVWPGQDPIGKRVKWGSPLSQAPWLTVVGVIQNVADGPIDTEPTVHAWEPFRQLPDFFLNDGATNQFGRVVKAAILADGDPRALAGLVRERVSTLDRALAVERVHTMDEQISDVVAPQRFSVLLIGGFAAIALGLAAVGLYGLLAYTIAQRRKEIAVRMALGAERRAVITMMIGHGARLVAVGLIAGVLGSLALVRVIAAWLYQTSPYDVVAFAIVPAVLVPAALLACAIPAWRAARVDPIAALRAD